MQRLTSRDNTVIKETVKLKNRAAYRNKRGLFVIEGARLIKDALHSGVKPEVLLCSDTAFEKHKELLDEAVPAAKKSYLLSDALFAQISDTVTPQGIMCVCELCGNVKTDADIYLPVKALALENIQDPSNMGNILRTAEALGVNSIFITKDCVDVYSPKVLRGSMGAVFRLSINIVFAMADLCGRLKELGVKIAATVPDSSAKPITSVKDFSNTVVIIGNEGNGIKNSTLDNCDERLTIPMLGRAESLNASTAAAIVLWEMQRKA